MVDTRPPIRTSALLQTNFRFYNSVFPTAAFATASALAALFFGVVTWSAIRSLAIAPIGFVLFWAVLAAILGWNASDRRVQIGIDDKGVRGVGTGGRTIPWSDIENFRFEQVPRGPRKLVLVLRSPEVLRQHTIGVPGRFTRAVHAQRNEMGLMVVSPTSEGASVFRSPELDAFIAAMISSANSARSSAGSG